MRKALHVVGLFAATALTLGFLVLPLAALFTRQSPVELVHQLSNPVVTDALKLSVVTSAIAQALILLLGTPTAYLVATRRFPGRSLVVTLVELPLVLPPAVAGIGLLVAFGRVGLLGSTFDALGISVAFNRTAVVLAVAFVASPLYLRAAIAAFEALDPNLVAASRTLGAGPVRTFFRVALPLTSAGLAAGAALSLARGLGEFGATIMFAGSLQGVTQTLPLAIYAEFDRDFDVAVTISALFVVITAAILLSLKLSALWRTSQRTSRSLFARLSWS
ncbi:MAG TPA: ABC transporter permease [Gaiellaceae bacterium]|jgi:molybdate transport system permease protein|nr:ABC transporter permease [Gaiellaceae bacterium]